MKPPQDPAIGREVDGYRIEAVLGRGGMGVVYKAEDVALSRPVALKRIDPGMGRDESFLRRFRSEARALARVNSPYITGIYTLRKTELGLLIVMEYVEGDTLEDLLLDGPMDTRETVAILRQMLQALEDAHSAHLIHRDIKPSNVLLTPAGTVKVTDFGLAKVLQRDVQATLTQGTAGTINYMSPEQIEGRADLDHRTDLFSLGMTAYEMLTGRLPFDRGSSDFVKMQAIVEASFNPPSQFRADTPDGLARIVMKALVKDPDERYQSAAAMREALAGLGDPTTSAPTKTAGTVNAPTVTAPTLSRADAPRAATSGTASETAAKAGAAQVSEGTSGERRAWIGVLVGVLVLALAAGGGYWLWAGRLPGVNLSNVSLTSQEASGEAQGGSNSESSRNSNTTEPGGRAGRGIPPSRRAQLTVETTPPGAAVYINGRHAGGTPLVGYAVESGSLAVQLKKPGRTPVDTLLRPEAGQSLALNLSLPDSAQGPATAEAAEAAPSKAAPSKAAPEASEGPAETEQAAGPSSQAQGVAPVDPSTSSRAPSSPPSSPAPQQPSTGAEAGESATLTVNVEPEGSVEWNGERHEGSGTFQVPPGWQTLKLRHPDYQTQEERLKLDPGQSDIRVYYFERIVRIKTESLPGKILIDGQDINLKTPHDLRLGPGRYNVRVRVPGHTVSGGQIIRYRPGGKQLAQFSGGNTKSVFVRPAFRDKAYEVIFRIQDE